MKMKSMLIVTLLCAIVLSGCSKSESSPQASKVELQDVQYMFASEPQASAAPAVGRTDMYSGTDNEMSGLNKDEETGEVAKADEKIVYTAQYTAETKDYDAFASVLDQHLSEVGGYLASANSTIYNAKEKLRNGYFVIKVPTEHYESTKLFLKNQMHVLSQSEQAENISGVYYDTQARLDLKRMEESRLIAILEKATTVEEILMIEEHLSDVRANIEILETQMKHMDRDVAYSTITLNLTEVKEVTVQTVSDDLGTKIKESFVGSINGVIRFFEAALLLLVQLIIPLLLLAIPILVGYRLWKHKKRKSK